MRNPNFTARLVVLFNTQEIVVRQKFYVSPYLLWCRIMPNILRHMQQHFLAGTLGAFMQRHENNSAPILGESLC